MEPGLIALWVVLYLVAGIGVLYLKMITEPAFLNTEDRIRLYADVCYYWVLWPLTAVGLIRFVVKRFYRLL